MNELYAATFVMEHLKTSQRWRMLYLVVAENAVQAIIRVKHAHDFSGMKLIDAGAQIVSTTIPVLIEKKLIEGE